MEHELNFMNIKCNQTINVMFKDLSFAVKVGFRGPQKQILKNLSGFFRSTELTAIMGPSGAGKSTLLNILSGFQNGSYTGTVEYLNENKQSQSNYKKQLCYIQQTDNLYNFFTVHEIMMISSYLKINWNISRKLRETLINDILNKLNLSHIKDMQIDRLSGGQKKKLSIALELIDNPPLMFLDEPTSNLDSSSSMQCIRMLKTLAQSGRTIVCTIHQPNAALYQIFDRIYLLVDGHCIFFSSPDDTVDYFARQGFQCPKYHNPADYMLEVVSREYGNYDKQLIEAAKRFTKPNNKTCSINSSHDMIQEIPDNQMMTRSPPTELMRFWVLLQRFMVLAHRDRTIMYIKLVLHTLVAILLGVMFERVGYEANKVISNLKYMFGNIIYLYFTNMLSSVTKFSLEIDNLQKERLNNWYQLRTYYMAMLVCSITLQIMFSFVYSFIPYFINSQPLELSRFLMFLLTSSLTSFFSDGIGLALSTILNPVNGCFVGAIIGVVFMCFGGLLILFKDMTSFMRNLSYLNPFRYSFDGYIYSIYGNNRENLQCPINYCHFRVTNLILEELDMTKSVFWVDVAVLFGCFVMLHLLTYTLLKRRLLRLN